MITGKVTIKSVSQLEKTLWTWFSRFIRLRDADKSGYCRCITCKKPFFWKEGDAGHFISRNHKTTKYDEKNVNAQCSYCNRFQSGNQFEHGLAIDSKYGSGTAANILQKSKIVSKRSVFTLNFMIEEYKKKAKIEAVKKGIKL